MNYNDYVYYEGYRHDRYYEPNASMKRNYRSYQHRCNNGTIFHIRPEKYRDGYRHPTFQGKHKPMRYGALYFNNSGHSNMVIGSAVSGVYHDPNPTFYIDNNINNQLHFTQETTVGWQTDMETAPPHKTQRDRLLEEMEEWTKEVMLDDII